MYYAHARPRQQFIINSRSHPVADDFHPPHRHNDGVKTSVSISRVGEPLFMRSKCWSFRQKHERDCGRKWTPLRAETAQQTFARAVTTKYSTTAYYKHDACPKC